MEAGRKSNNLLTLRRLQRRKSTDTKLVWNMEGKGVCNHIIWCHTICQSTKKPLRLIHRFIIQVLSIAQFILKF